MVLGTLAPAGAENLVNPALLGPNPAREATRINYESPEAQAGTTAQAPAKRWTTLGKALFGAGLGLAASGGVEVLYARSIKDRCTGGSYSYCDDMNYTVTKPVYRGVGYASIGAGAILAVIGLTRRD